MCIRDSHNGVDNTSDKTVAHSGDFIKKPTTDAISKCGSCHADIASKSCLLYTSDAADERSSVDLGGRRIIKKKKTSK